MPQPNKIARYPDIPVPTGKIHVVPLKDDGRIKPNGAVIRRLRKQRGLSRERMSEDTGLALKTLRNLENNPAYRCRPVTIDTLARFYETEPSLLVEQDRAPSLRLLTSPQEIAAAKIEIVASARTILACAGSGLLDEGHLHLIETALKAQPSLTHYRALPPSPFKQAFQEHLSRVEKLRGGKSLHIGTHDDLLKQLETSICANETAALIVLPPLFGSGADQTLLIEDAVTVEKYLWQIKALCQAGRPLDTEKFLSPRQ